LDKYREADEDQRLIVSAFVAKCSSLNAVGETVCLKLDGSQQLVHCRTAKRIWPEVIAPAVECVTVFRQRELSYGAKQCVFYVEVK